MARSDREYDKEYEERRDLADAVQRALSAITSFTYPEEVREDLEALIDAKIALALWEKDHY